MAYSLDGHILAAGGDDGTVRLWDTATGAPRTTLSGTSKIVSLVFSPGGSLVAAAPAPYACGTPPPAKCSGPSPIPAGSRWSSSAPADTHWPPTTEAKRYGPGPSPPLIGLRPSPRSATPCTGTSLPANAPATSPSPRSRPVCAVQGVYRGGPPGRGR
ncbi:hypothetical protein ACL07V_36775 [Streptomyces sp. MB22_4]|uniref:WD40 repeat domain-containing protein n=1 Tax=Streptomyces sp. MB22_4 TaxID=3383120 RepID=UPI0039A0DF0B